MLTKPDVKKPQTPSYSVPPVVRAIKVLRHIAAGRSVANQSRAAREIGINRTTLLRLLHTLEAEGMIERAPGGDDYRARHRHDRARRAEDVLARCRAGRRSPADALWPARLGLSCHLGILDGREVLYVLRATPNVHLVSNVRIGTRLPAHASSMGRAILAHLPARGGRRAVRGVSCPR